MNNRSWNSTLDPHALVSRQKPASVANIWDHILEAQFLQTYAHIRIRV